MTKIILQLGEKFAKSIDQLNDNARFSQQREKLSKFSKYFIGELKSIINEMDGDIFVLKEKQMDNNILKSFKETRNSITELTKQINPQNPYDGSLQLINWSEDRLNKSTLNNLKFIINHFLDKNKTDFMAGLHLQPARSESIEKFQHLINVGKEYIINNPLLPDPRNQSTIPPKLYNEKENESTYIGSQEKTVPGSPISKNKL